MEVIMKNKDKTISLRVTNEEYSILESNRTNLNMTISQYIRSSINHSLPAETNYRQLIAPAMCRIQIRLAELGMEDDEIVKEINKLCLML
jgi:predicted DNA-binding protein